MNTGFTINVLRCHECRILLHPQAPIYRRRIRTAVEVGTRTGRVDRYEVVDLCAQCDAHFAQQEIEEHAIPGKIAYTINCL